MKYTFLYFLLAAHIQAELNLQVTTSKVTTATTMPPATTATTMPPVTHHSLIISFLSLVTIEAMGLLVLLGLLSSVCRVKVAYLGTVF